MSVQHRVSNYRHRMRARGYRPVQIWVPDVRNPDFAAAARHQASLVAHLETERDDQQFIEAISAPWDEE